MPPEIFDKIVTARQEIVAASQGVGGVKGLEAIEQSMLSIMYWDALHLIERYHLKKSTSYQTIGVTIPVDYHGEQILVTFSRDFQGIGTENNQQHVAIAIQDWESTLHFISGREQTIGYITPNKGTEAQTAGIKQFGEVLDFMIGRTIPQTTTDQH